MRVRLMLGMLACAASMAAQEGGAPSPPGVYTIDAGTKVPLSLINSVSTKQAQAGDRVYLETAFPVLVNGRIAIPVGSWVTGTVTDVKKPGRVKGRGELYIRFDTLTLPNGVSRDFRARMGGMDASSSGQLDRAEGKVKSEGNKGGDTRVAAETTAAGTSVGGIVGHAAGHAGMGVGVGAAAGAAGALIYILTSRGPDATVAKGSTIEMTLDRALTFNDAELDFSASPARQKAPGAGMQ
jgi:hypothetical protein